MVNVAMSYLKTEQDHKITWEVIPSTKSPLYKKIENLDFSERQKFTAIATSIIYRDGENDLLKEINPELKSYLSQEMGSWDGNISPSNLESVVSKVAMKATKKEMVLLCAMIGYIFQQDAVPYAKMIEPEDIKKGDALGVSLDLGKGVDIEKAREVYKIAKSIDPNLEFSVTGSRVRFINFTDENGEHYTPHETFIENVRKVAECLPEETVELRHFAVEGELISNDWESSPTGREYLSILIREDRKQLIPVANKKHIEFLHLLKDAGFKFSRKEQEQTFDSPESAF